MNPIVMNALKAAGWNENRKLNREYIISVLKEDGYSLLDVVIDFLERYGKLLIRFVNLKSGFKNDTIDFDFKKAMDIEVIERVRDYESRVGKKMCIIGTAYREYMILLMAEDGSVYAAIDDFLCFVAESGFEAIEAIILDYDFVEIK